VHGAALSLKELHTVTGLSEGVTELHFTPGGSRLLARGRGNTDKGTGRRRPGPVWCWDVPRGHPVSLRH